MIYEFFDLEQKLAEQLALLKNEFGLKDNDLVRDYYSKWWEREVTKELEQRGLTADDDTMEGLVNRFAFDDKSMQLKDIGDPEIRKFVSEYQKTRLRDVKKVAQNPFEMVFLKVGASSLERILLSVGKEIWAY